MSEDSKEDIMPENSSHVGTSAPLITLNNRAEVRDVYTESTANQRTAEGESASVPSVIALLLRMLEAAKARGSVNSHGADGPSPSSDGTVREDPSADRVS